MAWERIYSIVIAEDEPILLNSMASKIDASGEGFRVSGTARNGVEALQIVGSARPDVLITDIQMPLMDGLMLIHEVSERYPDTLPVILSNHNDFEYAKEAMAYGVKHYLLKTQPAVEVSRLLSRLRRILMKRDRDALNAHMANLLLMGQNQKTYDFKSLEWARPLVFDLCFVHLGNLSNRHATPDLIAFYQELISIDVVERAVLAQIADAGRLFVFNVPALFGMCIAVQAAEGEPGMDYTALLAALKPECGGQSVNIYAAAEPTGLEDFEKTLYRLACASEDMRVASESGVSVLPTGAEPPQERERYAPVRQHAVFQSQNRQELRERVHGLVQQWQLSRFPQQRLEKQLARFVETAREHKSSLSIEEAVHTEYELIVALCRGETLDQLEQRMYWLAEDALFEGDELGTGDVESVVHQVGKYIRANYTRPISLDDIAASCHYTSSYLSKAFKKHLGVPPLKYIINLRVDKAKQLIKENGSLSFKAIGEMVGYPEQNYFSRIFKNVTGMSISEYAASLKEKR